MQIEIFCVTKARVSGLFAFRDLVWSWMFLRLNFDFYRFVVMFGVFDF